MTKYENVAEKIRKYINDKNTTDSKLPPERELCRIYGVSRQTVREALFILEQDRLIFKVQGSGIYIDEAYFASRNKIAVILKEEDEYVYPDMIYQFRKALKQEGYSSEFFFTHNKPSLEREILTKLTLLPLRGIISEPVRSIFGCINTDLYNKLLKKNIPTLFFREPYENMTTFPSISIDYYSGVYSLTKDLSNNHNSIYSIFLMDDNMGKYGYEGFLQSCIDSRIPIDENCCCLITEEDILKIRNNLTSDKLMNFVSKIESGQIICQNDEIGYYISKILMNKNISSVSIHSFDRSYLCDLSKGKINSYAPVKESLVHETVIGIISLTKNKPVNSRVINPYIHEATSPVSF